MINFIGTKLKVKHSNHLFLNQKLVKMHGKNLLIMIIKYLCSDCYMKQFIFIKIIHF